MIFSIVISYGQSLRQLDSSITTEYMCGVKLRYELEGFIYANDDKMKITTKYMLSLKILSGKITKLLLQIVLYNNIFFSPNLTHLWSLYMYIYILWDILLLNILSFGKYDATSLNITISSPMRYILWWKPLSIKNDRFYSEKIVYRWEHLWGKVLEKLLTD